jgi:hypothetical protein
VFTLVKLKAAPEDPIVGRRAQPPPEPEMVDGQEEYEVEAVKDSRLWYGKLEFLIAWKGYGREAWTWEQEEDVHAPGLVSAFYQANPDAPWWILSRPQEHTRTCAPRRGGNVRGRPVNAPSQRPQRRSICMMPVPDTTLATTCDLAQSVHTVSDR